MTFTIANILIFLVSFTNIFLGVLLLTHGERRWKDSFLALFIFCISLWGISIAMMTVIPNVIWPRLAFWFISISFVFFNFFLQNYFKEKGLAISKVIYGLSALGIFFWAVSLGNSIMSDIGALEDSVYFVGVSLGFGKWYNSLLLYFLTNFLYDVYLMFSAYRKVDIKAKSQIRLFFIGISFFAALGLITNLILPRLGIFSFNNLGPVFSLVMTSFMVYAVLRWRLFSIKVIATEIAVFLLWISFLFFIFSSISEQFWSKVVVPIAAIPLGIYIIRSTLNDVKRETREKEKEIQHRKEVEKLNQELQITNEKIDKTNKELDKVNAELEVANKRQKNLLHEINHDVKEILTEATGGFSILRDENLGKLPLDAKTFVETAFAKVREGTRRVMDFLHATNLEKGTVSFMMKPFDLRKTIEKVIEHYKRAAEEKELKLEIDIKDANYMFNGDEDQLSLHVFDNLISNAISYNISQGSITISLSKQSNGILFIVKDTGVGITSEDKAILFTEGGHGKDSRKINVHSTGNGLFIAKGVVFAHHGKIWAESEGAGKGSTFFVELPVQP